jgi:serine/threonine protein kinase
MAPEISTGNYGKQIDTYAAGIILYEMLSGHVPFDGESCGEILMKHLTAPPDLSKIPSEYLPIVSKALSKNPAQRYASMAEMARAVEALGPEPSRVPAAAPTPPPRAAAAPPYPPPKWGG